MNRSDCLSDCFKGFYEIRGVWDWDFVSDCLSIGGVCLSLFIRLMALSGFQVLEVGQLICGYGFLIFFLYKKNYCHLFVFL